ncbi:Hpt domain-containing protein [Eisenbergiella sp.]
MDNFKEIFVAYGVDYDATLRRFAGNMALYLRVLGMLPNDKSLEKLGAAIDRGDLDSAFEAAHTLKGVAGNLGLTPLFEAVHTIVEPLRAREERSDYVELYTAVQAEYQNAEAFADGCQSLMEEKARNG